MKTLLLLGLIAFGSVSFAASVTDGAVLSSTLAPEMAVPVTPVTSSVALTPIDLETPVLGMVTADAAGNPVEMVAIHTATSVPESAGAAFLALFGYILMLRRRTA
jgi:alpha-D-ribose 1-methylphosphonate 5-triphosphate synthase subunit PhnH